MIPWIYSNIFKLNFITLFLTLGMRIPLIKGLIKKLLKSKHELLYEGMHDMLFKNRQPDDIHEVVPNRPMIPESIQKSIDYNYQAQHAIYSSGKHSGTIYCSENEELNKSISYAMGMFNDSNAFETESFIGAAQLNADIANLTKRLFNGDDETYAFTTCGGTESIMSSIAAYKFWAREEKGITKPNIVFFSTAHAAFTKGSLLMEIEPREIPVDKNGFHNPQLVYKYMDSNTIALVTSACGYAHGNIDDIETIAGIAHDHNIGCHVDNCLGGFVNCFVEFSQKKVLPFDFRVKGVTSISADTHKYGYGPKGMSVCMLRPKKLFDYLKFTSVDHSGVPFSVNNFGTTRSGAIVAGTWTALMKTGLRSYADKVKKVNETTLRIREEMKKSPDLKLYGPNNCYNMVCFDTVNFNPIGLSSKMKYEKGWHLSEVQHPPLCHILITDANLDKSDGFLEDLKDCIELAKKAGKKYKVSGYQALYGVTTKIKDASILEKFIEIVLDCSFSTTLERAKIDDE
uniref:sphinganine-1-phosphate aldolase n=1 Tax=Euplotes harpa TaxID=151035 RepID=A0A7S3NBI7_9SPIT